MNAGAVNHPDFDSLGLALAVAVLEQEIDVIFEVIVGTFWLPYEKNIVCLSTRFK